MAHFQGPGGLGSKQRLRGPPVGAPPQLFDDTSAGLGPAPAAPAIDMGFGALLPGPVADAAAAYGASLASHGQDVMHTEVGAAPAPGSPQLCGGGLPSDLAPSAPSSSASWPAAGSGTSLPWTRPTWPESWGCCCSPSPTSTGSCGTATTCPCPRARTSTPRTSTSPPWPSSPTSSWQGWPWGCRTGSRRRRWGSGPAGRWAGRWPSSWPCCSGSTRQRRPTPSGPATCSPTAATNTSGCCWPCWAGWRWAPTASTCSLPGPPVPSPTSWPGPCARSCPRLRVPAPRGGRGGGGASCPWRSPPSSPSLPIGSRPRCSPEPRPAPGSSRPPRPSPQRPAGTWVLRPRVPPRLGLRHVPAWTLRAGWSPGLGATASSTGHGPPRARGGNKDWDTALGFL